MQPTFDRQDLAARLAPVGQQHLLRFWHELDAAGQQNLAAQISSVDLEQVDRLYRQGASTQDWAGMARRAHPPIALRISDRQKGDILFFRRTHDRKNPHVPKLRGGQPLLGEAARQRGVEVLTAGKVGVLLVAGGQGSRLGFDRAKGLYPIGPISGAPLLQIHFEKALATARRYGASVPIYMMTSPVTHDEQSKFLHQRDWYGMSADDVVLFRQGTMPAVDAKTGKLLLAEKNSLFLSPDGHGGTVAALAASGAIDHMRRRGIEHLFYLQVDNPLTPIADPEFIGYHLLAESELTSMAVTKQTPKDRLGVFSMIDLRMQVIEYSDLPDDVAEKRTAHGSLEFWAGSIAVHMLSVEFLERALALKDALPFHIARKKVPYIGDAGQLIEPSEPNALKFERFIFDLLPHAKNPLVVEYAESDVFAPLKNAPGAPRDTPEYVHQFMIAQHRKWLTAAGTLVADGTAVEISPLWALDAEAVATRSDRPATINKPTYLS